MGTQTQFRFLPEVATDFTFAAVAEEWGFAGITFFFSLFGLMLSRLFRTALRAEDNFGKVFAFGIGLVISIHFIVNISMSVGLLPVVGLPLPFFSYGGSHLVAMALGVGFVESINTHVLRGLSKNKS